MLTLDKLYELLGSYYLMDFFHMFILGPITLIGFILNTISVSILLNRSFFRTRFYEYLCVVCLKSAIRNLFTVFLMFFLSRRYFAFASAYWASLVLGYLITPVLTTLFLFGSLVDIWITLEKLARFKRIYNKLLIFSPFKTSIILLASSMLINSPTYFRLTSANMIVLDTNKNMTTIVYYLQLTSFSKSHLGKNLIRMVVIFKSTVVLAILIVLNFIILKILRKYFKQKVTMTSKRDVVERRPSTQNGVIQFKQKMQHTNEQFARVKNQHIFKIKRISKIERRTLKMIAIFCTATILEHMFFMLVSLSSAYFGGLFIQVITTLGIFYCTLKNTWHFFVLYHYNPVFRRIVRLYLRNVNFSLTINAK
jgi:hypothetical protein